ncbi:MULTISPECIES: MspA family porin [unclassified Rhodococcus (in: high G+C Gram-positive bacteria)]|uniref:MspA family porin n=1 Tax=unclassified Rhodococcus (in: high G+C Gram-positive bacteria) TaxID=192944 RepID=UPI00163A31EF|nr:MULTISPECIES: MspA family porin [unclassified Rhodococcus (in: high G+C Gram-positive bacteria)]MBC2638233.1 MspA family porin [Rhodococcus sp. 3A]MBC2897024.1 MspA family porin [Rhodococcus sp. 4CII]
MVRPVQPWIRWSSRSHPPRWSARKAFGAPGRPSSRETRHDTSRLRRILSPARTATLLSLAALTLGLGTGTANAAVIPIADSTATKTTVLGTNLEIAQTGQWLNDVIPLNGTPFDKDVFFGGNTAIKSSGGTPITAGTVDVGVEVGYMLDVSNGLSLGGKVGITPQQSLALPVGGLPTLSMSVQTPLEGNWVVPIRPGQIVAISLNKKTMTTGNGNINLDNIHFQINGAGGPVSLRTYSQWTASTKETDDSFAAYGPPITL